MQSKLVFGYFILSVPRIYFKERAVQTDERNDSWNTSSKFRHYEGGGAKSEMVGNKFGVVGQQKEVFEGKVKDFRAIGGGGGKMKVVPTRFQPRSGIKRVEKEDTGSDSERTPMGILNSQLEDSLQDPQIRRFKRTNDD